jgi:hypothetical protein
MNHCNRQGGTYRLQELQGAKSGGPTGDDQTNQSRSKKCIRLQAGQDGDVVMAMAMAMAMIMQGLSGLHHRFERGKVKEKKRTGSRDCPGVEVCSEVM